MIRGRVALCYGAVELMRGGPGAVPPDAEAFLGGWLCRLFELELVGVS